MSLEEGALWVQGDGKAGAWDTIGKAHSGLFFPSACDFHIPTLLYIAFYFQSVFQEPSSSPSPAKSSSQRIKGVVCTLTKTDFYKANADEHLV